MSQITSQNIERTVLSTTNFYRFSPNTLKQQVIGRIDKPIKLKGYSIKQNDKNKVLTFESFAERQLELGNNGLQDISGKIMIDMKPYSTVYIQKKMEYQEIYKKVQEQKKRIRQNLTKLNDPAKGLINMLKPQQKQIHQNTKNQLERDQNILNKINVDRFVKLWHDQLFNFRVSCIHKDTLDNITYDLWIYVNTEQQAIMIRDKIILQHLQKLNGQYLTRLSKQFSQQISKRYVALLIEGLQKKSQEERIQKEMQQYKRQQMRRKFDKNKFFQLENVLMRQLMQKWKNKTFQKRKNLQKKLFIQVNKIKIDKKHCPKTVFLQINQKQKVKFQYLQSQGSHFVYVPKTTFVQTFEAKEFQHKNLQFKVITEKQKNILSNFYSNITFDKIDQNQLGFQFENGLIPENESDIDINFTQDYPFLICFQSLVRKYSGNMNSLTKYRKLRLLQNLGEIPDSFFRSYYFPYNPNNFKLIQSIVSKNSFPLTKQSYQKTYLDLVSILCNQQNKSRNYSLFISQYKRKILDIKTENCYKMIQRFEKYSELLEVTSFKFSLELQYNNTLKRKPIMVNSANLSNLRDDLIRFQNNHKGKYIDSNILYNVMHKLLIIMDIYNQNIQKNPKVRQSLLPSSNYIEYGSEIKTRKPFRYCSGMIEIAQNILYIVQYNNQNQFRVTTYEKQQQVQQDTVWLLSKFLFRYYPYSQVANLQLQIFHIRALAQKYLPQFCRTLNRKNIGLQNFISKYLLQLFCPLNKSLNYRIWDLLLNMNDPFKARIIIAYTLLVFMETTQLLPLIPINKFIIAVRQNDYKIKLQSNYVSGFIKNIQSYGENNKQKQKSIIKIAQEKYLKRFILSKNSNEIPLEDQKKPLDLKNNSKTYNNLFSLNLLRYPLPQPNYMGIPISKIHILVSSIYILETINFNRTKYILKFSYDDQSQQIQLKSKNCYLNKFISFNPNLNIQQIILIQIFELTIELSQKVFMSQLIYLQNYHKDYAYKVNLNFSKKQQKAKRQYQTVDVQILYQPYKNKGQSTLSLVLCLKSIKSKEIITEDQNHIKYLNLCQRLLDYDLDPQCNEGITAVLKYINKIQKMKCPLDQFGTQHYTSIKISTANISQDQWKMNSKVSLQQLKAIFYTIFYQQDQMDLRLQFSSYYQLYTSNNNYKYFDLGLFLFQLIMIVDISRQKKITLLYCLCLHYQNCFSKSITIQTLNSIIKSIHNQHNFLNACPYFTQFSGAIQQAYFYLKGQKVQQRKRDITNIIQDWAYISRLRFCYGGLILGSSQNLLILRSLLTSKTLKQIMVDKLCRFEIIYCYNEYKYIWSAVVNTQDFTIVYRGNRFLNSYPTYYEVSYVDSTAQILLNCQNVIPLESNNNLNYQQFSNKIKNNQLFNYLLTQPSQINKQYSTKKSPIDYFLKPSYDINSSNIRKKQKKQNFYDYAIYRFQNCIEQWKKCKIISQEEDAEYAIVEFEFKDKNKKQRYYQIPTFELINMEENLQWEEINKK